jgi:ribosome-associated protein
MKEDLFIKEGMVIPEHELEISASRSGGPGGQHVNKTSSKITVRWNIPSTTAFDDNLKQRLLSKLAGILTSEGDLIVHNSSSRSQQQNKQAALANLANRVRNALVEPKKRMKSKLPKAAKESRLESKKRHSSIKRMRSKKIIFD